MGLARERRARRIGQQPTADLRRTEYGLAVFGKPLRKVNCDCEREEDPSLLQAIYLRNDPDVAKMLDRPDGWLKSIRPSDDPASLIEEAYLRTVSRLPDAGEKARCVAHLKSAGSLAEGMRDVLWAQRDYRAAHGAYARSFAELGLKVPPTARYTYFLGDTLGPGGVTLPDLPQQPGATADSFLAACAANLDADPALDVWIITAEGEPQHVLSDD